MEEEKTSIGQVRHWLGVENSIVQQKARVRWLKLGDEKSGFYHAVLKARKSSNRIDKLVTEDGMSLDSKE